MGVARRATRKGSVRVARRWLTRCFFVAGRGLAYNSVLVSARAGAPLVLMDVA